MSHKPYLIPFPAIGESSIGYISVVEAEKQAPFPIRRVYWTYFTPESIVRGRHAHRSTEQILIAVNGRITVTIETKGVIEVFVLEKPDKGLYIPPNSWHTMEYSHAAVQLVLASAEYDSKEYIRDYEEFKRIWGKAD
jgi:mannose-6-phosphate isomerase-like protein (cupin superfamily)